MNETVRVILTSLQVLVDFLRDSYKVDIDNSIC